MNDSTTSKSADIRANLGHPVVDADGHWIEPIPLFLDYLREVGGTDMRDQVIRDAKQNIWYDLSPEERLARRMPRPWWWGETTHTMDRATSMIPGLLHHRLDEFGVDFSIIYSTLGFDFIAHPDAEIRQAACRALNNLNRDAFDAYKTRLTPAAVIPLVTPDEAIAELDYAVGELGFKVAMINNHIRRPIPAHVEAGVDPARAEHYIDNLLLESEYDYDPLWAKFVEHRIAVTTHADSIGWSDRRSGNFIYNHVGHFAAASHAFTKGLVLSGVLHRFPTLKFAMLEGGVGWACTLLIDLIEHWEKRTPEALMQNTLPTNLDMEKLAELMKQYGGKRYEDKLEELLSCTSMAAPFLSPAEAAQRDIDQGNLDDFVANPIKSEDELRSQFSNQLFFGCESDDLSTVWAFDKHDNHRLKALFSSDFGHFDVVHMNRVLEEAHELVEHEMLSSTEFEEFVFGNTVDLHTAMNPDFFVGTVVEDAVNAWKARKA